MLRNVGRTVVFQRDTNIADTLVAVWNRVDTSDLGIGVHLLIGQRHLKSKPLGQSIVHVQYCGSSECPDLIHVQIGERQGLVALIGKGDAAALPWRRFHRSVIL